MSKKELYKMIQSTGLEYKLNKMDIDIETEIFMNDAYMEYIDEKYNDKLRDLELVQEVRRRMTNLLKLINRVNEIEERAIAINNHDLVWSCEMRKSKLVGQMELLRSKYDF